MKQEFVYIVCGETGEYSDHHIWSVYAFRTKELAEAYAAEANKWAASLKERMAKEGKAYYEISEEVQSNGESKQYDPCFHMDCNRVGYYVEEVPYLLTGTND